MIELTVLGLVLSGTTFLLGFHLGDGNWTGEIVRVRMQAAKAERQIHALTRQALASMVEEVQRRRQQPYDGEVR